MKLSRVVFHTNIGAHGISGEWLDAVRDSVSLTLLQDGSVLIRKANMPLPVIATASNVANWVPHKDEIEAFEQMVGEASFTIPAGIDVPPGLQAGTEFVEEPTPKGKAKKPPKDE